MKQPSSRPKAAIGLRSDVTEERMTTRPGSAKPPRNRNRVTSAKPPAPARRLKR